MLIVFEAFGAHSHVPTVLRKVDRRPWHFAEDVEKARGTEKDMMIRLSL